jgi:hypothetical protein
MLQSREGWTSQDHGNKASEGHSHAAGQRGIGWSGHGKEACERRALTSWRTQSDGRVRTWKGGKRARGTHFLESVENGLVRTWKGSERAKGTHELESADGWTSRDMERKRASKGTHILQSIEGWTSQDMERKRASEGYSHAAERRGMK